MENLMKKLTHLKTGFFELLLGEREFLYEFTFFLGLVTLVIGMLIMFNAVQWIHILAGFLIFLSGIASILTAIIPLPELRKTVDLVSFGIILYGFIKIQSITTVRILAYSMLLIYTLLYIWKIALEYITDKKKRGE